MVDLDSAQAKQLSEGFDSKLTEWQIMQQQKYDRIWDCGQTRWEYHANNKPINKQ